MILLIDTTELNIALQQLLFLLIIFWHTLYSYPNFVLETGYPMWRFNCVLSKCGHTVWFLWKSRLKGNFYFFNNDYGEYKIYFLKANHKIYRIHSHRNYLPGLQRLNKNLAVSGLLAISKYGLTLHCGIRARTFLSTDRETLQFSVDYILFYRRKKTNITLSFCQNMHHACWCNFLFNYLWTAWWWSHILAETYWNEIYSGMEGLCYADCIFLPCLHHFCSIRRCTKSKKRIMNIQ